MGTRGREGRAGWIQPSQLLWKLSDAARQRREAKTLAAHTALGRRGEDVAHRYLRSAGYAVVARNYRPGGGQAEVDIVARDGDTVVFVEVKARTTDEFGSPDRAIGAEKRKHILRAARAYATRAGIQWSQVRFDIISIVFTNPPSIIHQKDAFFEGRAR
ncbi:MAG: YraN family protein [Bryobacteraceae bacterium]